MPILEVNSIPKTLYYKDILYFSNILTNSYKNKLEEIDLYYDAISEKCSDPKIEGGCDKDASELHYACRYLASASRLQYAMLGLHDSFLDFSEYLLTTFSDGSISLLDIPCGTGAGTFSVISTLYELRQHKKLPSLPLDIHLVAADCSTDALEIFQTKIKQLIPELENYNIHLIVHSFELWDARDESKTAKIVDQWLKIEAEEKVVLISAFSGATRRKSDFDNLNFIFQNLRHRLLVEPATLLFVEPEMKSTEDDYFSWIKKLFPFQTITNFLHKIFGGAGDFKWFHPFLYTIKYSKVIVLKIQRDGRCND
jgi:hypothetical protein